jgi:hypothetical protein
MAEKYTEVFSQLFRGILKIPQLQDVPPGYEHLNIGRIKLYSSMTFI